MRRMFVCCVMLLSAQPLLAQEPDAQAVAKAKSFLDSGKPWPFVNLCVHFGTDYRGGGYVKTLPVQDARGPVPGQFGLVYDYRWTGGGETQLEFLCDARGNIFRVRVLADNGAFNQPFKLANASIQLVGDWMYENLQKDLNEANRRRLRQLIAAADAQSLLAFGLRLPQANP